MTGGEHTQTELWDGLHRHLCCKVALSDARRTKKTFNRMRAQGSNVG